MTISVIDPLIFLLDSCDKGCGIENIAGDECRYQSGAGVVVVGNGGSSNCFCFCGGGNGIGGDLDDP